MLDSVTTIRLLLPFIGIGIVLIVIKLIKPPRVVLHSVLKLCWIAGVLNFFVDVVQVWLGFWHYTIDNLFFGYPLDLYLAVSLVIGGALPLVFWWLRSFHPRWIIVVMAILPFYFLFQDYIIQKTTDDRVVVWDSSNWWVADLLALSIIIYGTLIIINLFLRHK